MKYTLLLLVLITAGTAEAIAQKYPERGDIRKGNREYNKGRYEDSEKEYLRAAEKNPESFEANYNLGNALYRQGKWDGAESVFSQTAKAGTSRENRFNSHFNAGNAMFQQRKLQEALEEYKEALRINPNDMEAKFNLAYVKKMLEDDENDGGEDGDDDQDNDDNDDNSGNDNQDNEGDGNSDPDQGDNDDKDGDGDNQPDKGEGQPQERPGGMTREEAENLLDAMQGNEDRTREKAEEKKAATVERSDKNW